MIDNVGDVFSGFVFISITYFAWSTFTR